MKLTDLSKEDKTQFYKDFKNEMFLEYPLLKVPNQNSFFQDEDPTKKPSFWKRLYYTIF